MPTTQRRWTYPTIARYHAAMAELASSTHNLPFFMEHAANNMTERSLDLVAHNLSCYRDAQARAIGFASIT